jgi:peptidoglycan-associated lipoprotein
VGARGQDFVWRSFADIQFEPGKANIPPADAAKVAEIAAFMKEHPAFMVELEGYTDPRGTQRYNLTLSQRRVEAVRSALIAEGVPDGSIVTGAYGELNPRCQQQDEACWQQNRRVEVLVVPDLSGRIGGASPRLDPRKLDGR